jgi:uncharacterized protein with PQ loop repeat
MHHWHIRKRMSRALEPYPARRFWMRMLDWLIYSVGVIGPVMTIPQIVLIFGTRQATGVSAVAWFAWAVMDIPWIVYGFAHKEPPIMVTYLLWFIGNLTVAIGAILYS